VTTTRRHLRDAQYSSVMKCPGEARRMRREFEKGESLLLRDDSGGFWLVRGAKGWSTNEAMEGKDETEGGLSFSDSGAGGGVLCASGDGEGQ